jgi:hypothetical protein
MSFKYIDPDNVGYTAGDADELSELAFDKVYPDNEKVMVFRLGNTGDSANDYTITGESINSGIIDSFYISDDGETYEPIASGIVIPNLAANQISDPVYVKFDIPEDAYISSGTIRILTVEG